MVEGDTGHGLWVGGLTTWLPETEYTIGKNDKVYDLIEMALEADPSLTMYARWTEQFKSYYIYAVKKDDVLLTEKDNWKNSGWMVAVNGKHVQVGVSNMTLADGDEVILHWCDDFYIDEAEGARQAFLAAKPKVKVENAKNGKIKLTWEEIENAMLYRVFIAEAEDGEYTLAAEVEDPTYTHDGTIGKKYFFKVQAVSFSDLESKESDPVSGVRLPAQVISLKATTKKGQVTLKWKKVSGAKKYFVYMSQNGKSGWKKVGTATTNKFVYKKGKVGAKLYFKVRAVTANGKKGEFSKVVSIKVKK